MSVAEVQFDSAAGGHLGGGGGGRAQLTTGAGAQGQTGAAPAVAAADGSEPQAGRGPGPAAVPRPAPGFPREYQVQLSLDGKDWGKPLATGQGSPLTVVSLSPTKAKFIPDHPDWIGA